jgi:hypothetical protein
LGNIAIAKYSVQAVVIIQDVVDGDFQQEIVLLEQFFPQPGVPENDIAIPIRKSRFLSEYKVTIRMQLPPGRKKQVDFRLKIIDQEIRIYQFVNGGDGIGIAYG